MFYPTKYSASTICISIKPLKSNIFTSGNTLVHLLLSSFLVPLLDLPAATCWRSYTLKSINKVYLVGITYLFILINHFIQI